MYLTVISSYTHAVNFKNAPLLIGERINPTGKKRFKQALVEGDMDYIVNEGIAQQEKGVHILDVNVGLPDIDEKALLCEAVQRLQAVIDLPLQIDTAAPDAMEAALRRYNLTHPKEVAAARRKAWQSRRKGQGQGEGNEPRVVAEAIASPAIPESR